MRPGVARAVGLALVVTATAAIAEPVPDDVDDYFSRKRGIGMFHRARVALGGFNGQQPALMGVPARGNTDGATSFAFQMDLTELGVRTRLGNYAGYELSVGLRTHPAESWSAIGSAVTFLNLGDGGAGSLRLGGAFGIGGCTTWNATPGAIFKHSLPWAYVRGRGAVVLIRKTLDAELSMRWTPASASRAGFDERDVRLSFWYRRGPDGVSAWEGYVEWFQRQVDDLDSPHEFVGIGGGVGLAY